MLYATILEAEEARDAEFKAILAEEYNLQLPNATVGAKRKRASAPARVDHIDLLPRAERACREARQALEEAELHQRQVGPPSSIRDPELRDTAACDDEALAADQREWMREWEIRKEAEKAWWLATFLHDRRKHQLHKVRMAAWHEAERRDELALEEAEQEGTRGKALADLSESLEVARMRLMGKVGQRWLQARGHAAEWEAE